MKTIYRIGKGYVTLDTYTESHESHRLAKAVLASLLLAAIISSISGLAMKYGHLVPSGSKAGSTQVIGY